MNWQEIYKHKLISAEEAATFVHSGDRVVIPVASEPLSLMTALIARKEELRGVEVLVAVPVRDLPWYELGWDESFHIKVYYPGSIPELRRKLGQSKIADYVISLTSQLSQSFDGEKQVRDNADIVMTEVSLPDRNGFCSFGPVLWNKRELIKRARISIAEVHPEFIRTYGDNFIHINDIHYFVESSYALVKPFPPFEPEPHVKTIAGYVSTLIRDSDTIEIGAGTTSETLPMVGVFNGKHDLGWHTERIPRGTLRVMREQPELFTGKYKTLNQGKMIATALAPVDEDDLRFVACNPVFELRDSSYVNNILTIAAHDNMVAINNAISVDLTGQVASETIGAKLWAGAGGQTEYAIGAMLSRGGRSIIVLPSTTNKGTTSRIVPMFEKGTAVTVQRAFADYVVTEYGIARLRGKSQRERAQELIAVSHPDFRSALAREAKLLYCP